MSNFLKNLHPLLRRGKDEKDNKDPNYALIDMFEKELSQVEKDTVDSKIQSTLKKATGKYLDLYGEWYGLYRQDNEDDETYRNNIITYVLLKRGTNGSIIQAIKRFFDNPDVNVEVYEPLNNIFYLNNSKLNGNDKLMGDYYRFSVIDVTIGGHFDTSILETINKFKPAGVKIVFTYDGGYTNIGSEILNIYEDIQPKIISYQETDRLTGYGKIGYGHINLLLPKEYYSDEIFITNNSSLNSTDILSGSQSKGRKYYNSVYDYSKDYTPSNFSQPLSMEDTNGTELDNSIYTKTTKRDTNYFFGTVSDPNSYYYFNIDMLQTMLNKGIKVNQLDNPIQYISDYLGFTNIDLDTKTYTPPNKPVKITLQVYNFNTEEWITINSTDVGLELKNIGGSIGSLVDYINFNYLLIFRISFKSDDIFDLEINYFDIHYTRVENDIYSLKMKYGSLQSNSETVPIT